MGPFLLRASLSLRPCRGNRRELRRRRQGRAGRRSGLGRTGAGALLGRHQGRQDLPPRREAATGASGTRRSGSARSLRGPAAVSSPGPIAALPTSTSTSSGSKSVSTPRRIARATASTTARSTARGASGPAPWTMGRREASGALYRLRPNRACDPHRRWLPGHQRAGFQPDGRTMYHNDSALQVTYAFDLGADGNRSTSGASLPASARATAIPTG